MLFEIIGVFLILLIMLKIYLTVGHVHYTPTESMIDKTVIITGANGGIGRETTLALAKCGARIIMACRNLITAEQVRCEIIALTNNKNLIIKSLDLSSQQSIRSFAVDINATEDKIDVLIHNAGMVQLKLEKNADNIEMMMATNHYGSFLLTHLLMDLLKRSRPSRILVVSSFGHFFHWGYAIDPNPEKKNWSRPWEIYFQTKLSNIFFTQELARRIAGSGVMVNCLNPGMINTEIYSSISLFPFSTMFRFSRLFYSTAKEGADTTLYLATAREGGEVSGEYFSNCKIYKKKFGTVEKQKEFWEISAKLMLRDGDPTI